MNPLKQLVSGTPRAQNDSAGGVRAPIADTAIPQEPSPVQARKPKRVPVPIPIPTRPVCPYCRAPVPQTPRYKGVCQRCGQTYYARVRPGDKQPSLLTGRQAAALDENREALERAIPPRKAWLDPHEGRFNWFWAYSTAEGQWRQLRRSLTLHVRDGNWLLYRNARFEMAELRRRQARLKEALQIYLEVWYLDLNGPHDCWGMMGQRRVYESAPWHPADGLTTPVVARWTHRLAAHAHWDMEVVERNFRQIAERSFRQLGLPLSPAEAWRTLRNELVL